MRIDETSDARFYSMPRLVTHIDDHAISTLSEYYSSALPSTGKVLDLCSSWVSFIPDDKNELEVVGLGMNRRELAANDRLGERIVQDLNVDPSIPDIGPLDAAMCVVSIDYLNKPLEVLGSIKSRMREGGRVHLVVSNRCFPTKVVRRWLDISETDRLEMVGDYLHFAGYSNVEIVTLSDGTAESDGKKVRVDPLWVVRGQVGEQG
jgi:hypothetical protein